MSADIKQVVVPVTDMWLKPRFESRRTNQILYGHSVTVRRKYGAWLYAETEDGYVGWINREHLQSFDPQKGRGKRAVIKSLLAPLLEKPGGGRLMGMLSFGSLPKIEREKMGWGWIDAYGGWIDLRNLARPSFRRPSPNRILHMLRLFLGRPYLWGGRSAYGLDCSGLVQLVYNFCGCSLPRDTKDLIRCGRRIDWPKIAPADLVFSPGHVAVWIGCGRILHSSLKAGGVKIESLDKTQPDYRHDIAENIIQIRRVV